MVRTLAWTDVIRQLGRGLLKAITAHVRSYDIAARRARPMQRSWTVPAAHFDMMRTRAVNFHYTRSVLSRQPLPHSGGDRVNL